MKKIRDWRTYSFYCGLFLQSSLDNDAEYGKAGAGERANMMLKTMNESNKETFDIIAVFNSGSNKALTDTKKYSIASVIKALQDKKS